MNEYVKIHVERYRLSDEGVSENMACAEHTFSTVELAALIANDTLILTLHRLIGMTAQALNQDQA